MRHLSLLFFNFKGFLIFSHLLLEIGYYTYFIFYGLYGLNFKDKLKLYHIILKKKFLICRSTKNLFFIRIIF